MNKLLAEGIGTFALVFFGCCSIIFAGPTIDFVTISFAFGLTVTAMAYTFGSVSGAHLNPAVSLGFFLSGRLSLQDFLGYSGAQIIGGLVATGLIWVMDYDPAMAATGPGSTYGVTIALIFEIIATFIFVTLILAVTKNADNAAVAGLIIGLTLVMIHLVGIRMSGASVNPARSIATNVFSASALKDLWIYLVGPLVGGGLAGIAHKAGLTRS